jgi:2-hydroxy-6-oxo-octa-2,4-dienoate hydrolase
VIAPDLLGFGQTDLAVDGKYNPKIWGLHFRGFLDALGLKRVSLVGNSFGGGVALGLALRKPEMVRHLVLMGAPAGEFAMSPGLRATYEYEPSLENLRAVLGHFPYDPELITEELLEQRLGPSARPGAQDVLRQLYPKPSSDGSATIMHTMPEDKLGGISAPTLVLHGREDHVIPFDCALRLHRNIPDSELHSFGNCGHWVQAEHPDAFVELVSGFVARG